MKRKDIETLAEAKIREAQARGEFDNLKGKGEPLPPDALGSLSSEERVRVLALKSCGGVPEELQLKEEIAALEEAVAAEEDEALRAELRRRLRRVRIELSLLYERTGRFHAANPGLKFVP
jgi:hypothetical protein